MRTSAFALPERPLSSSAASPRVRCDIAITHMPPRLALVTALVIAAALGVYYVFEVSVVAGRDWEALQGSVHQETDSAAGHDYAVFRVRRPDAGPWFAYHGLARSAAETSAGDQETVLTFRARTSTGVSGYIELAEIDGPKFRHSFQLQPTDNWVRLHLPLAQFASVSGGTRRVDPGELEPTVLFGLSEEAAARGRVVLNMTSPEVEPVVSPK